MRKKLSVVQIILTLVAGILPLLDGMFIWYTHNSYVNLGQKPISLNNLMTVQQICGGPALYWIFNICLAAMLVYCVLELFREDLVSGKRLMIAIPSAAVLLCVVMSVALNSYADKFTWEGEIRYASVGLGVLAYVEIAVLAGNLIIELYKQFKSDIYF